ncbi:MAG TPA: DUF892 family protein [Solirubrobacteraceae bacterium]|jgi:ferritin-like metal-binding protein YciE
MTTLHEQLTKYLIDAHAIEEQALVQLRRAPELAGDPAVAASFAAHLEETEGHEIAVAEALAERHAEPSAIKEAVMRAGGAGFVLFARLQPDTPGKLATHAYSYEHLELASYELLRTVARIAGEEPVVRIASAIAAQERAMAERLANSFDLTTAASLQGRDAAAHLTGYLADAHAIEMQSTTLLERAPKIVEDELLASLFEAHLEETREHAQLLESRLSELDAGPSHLKDAAMKLGALNWGGFFQAHPDTPGKLTAFAFAFEHLEIGGYEHLLRVARIAQDDHTARIAEHIIAQERTAARALAAAFDHAARLSLQAAGVDLSATTA